MPEQLRLRTLAVRAFDAGAMMVGWELVVFLMGARFNWIFHPGFRRGKLGQAPRYAKDMKVIQLDIAPEEPVTDPEETA